MHIEVIDNQLVWEKFLLSHQPGALFQSWQWGQVQQKLGQKVWRLGLYGGSRELRGIFLVVKVRARRGTFLHIRHGPILARDDQRFWQVTLTYLRKLAADEGASFIRISPQLAPNETEKFRAMGLRAAPIHAMDAEYCWVLDLAKSEEELLSGMRKTTRYEIRQAQKLGVKVTKSVKESDLRDFLKLYQTTASRQGFVTHVGLKEEFEIFAKNNQATLFLGRYQGQILAGALVLFYGNQAIYHHGASAVSKIPASYLIQWEAIKEAKARGLSLYNFWGIAGEDNPRHPWQGISLFKKGFGGRPVQYLHALDLPLSAGYWLSWLVETVRRVRKGY